MAGDYCKECRGYWANCTCGENMSETPRTDLMDEMWNHEVPEGKTVPSDFARHLEQELNTANTRLKYLESLGQIGACIGCTDRDKRIAELENKKVNRNDELLWEMYGHVWGYDKYSVSDIAALTDEEYARNRDITILRLHAGTCTKENELNKRIAELEARFEQSVINVNFLLSKIDALNDLLCPEYLGTWQNRAEHVVLKTTELAEKYKDACELIEDIYNSAEVTDDWITRAEAHRKE